MWVFEMGDVSTPRCPDSGREGPQHPSLPPPERLVFQDYLGLLNRKWLSGLAGRLDSVVRGGVGRRPSGLLPSKSPFQVVATEVSEAATLCFLPEGRGSARRVYGLRARLAVPLPKIKWVFVSV